VSCFLLFKIWWPYTRWVTLGFWRRALLHKVSWKKENFFEPFYWFSPEGVPSFYFNVFLSSVIYCYGMTCHLATFVHSLVLMAASCFHRESISMNEDLAMESVYRATWEPKIMVSWCLMQTRKMLWTSWLELHLVLLGSAAWLLVQRCL